MSFTITRPTIPVPLPLTRGGTEGTTAAEARTKLELGDLAMLTAPGGTTTFLRADKTWAVPPGGGGGAPTDAEYITSTANATLSAERVLTDTATITWDRTTAGQIKANAVGSGYTDEQAQDAVGAMLTNTSTVNLTYVDATPALSATVNDASITEAKLGLSDVTTKDASTTAHGLLRKLSGTATEYLNGAGAWTTPAGGGTNYWQRGNATGPSYMTGMLAWWRMEEASGNRIDSVSGLALIPQGTVAQITSTTGRHGQAVKFNATAGTYLSCPHTTQISAGANQSFTFAFWYLLDAALTSGAGLLCKGDSNAATTLEYEILYSSPLLYNRMSNGSSQASATVTAPTATATWHFVVGWFDQSTLTMSLQVNNGTPGSAANTFGSYTTARDLQVGRRDVTSAITMNGRIDNVMFWKRVLTAQERADLWNGGAGVDYGAGPLPYLAPLTATDGLLLGTARTTQEKLETDGAIKLGTTTGTTDGTLRWTGTDFEGRKAGAWVSMTGAGGQPLDATLTALAGLATGADQLPYATGTDTFAQTTLTAFARTLLDDTTQAAMRTTLGLTPGTDVQAQDAELQAIAGLTSAADRLPYFTGAGTAALATFTTAGRNLVDDADTAAQRATLGLGTMAQQDASAVNITGGSAVLQTAIPGHVSIDWQGNPVHGLLVNDAPAGAHNGILILVSAGTDRRAINAAGTAPSYFGGTVQVAGTLGVHQAPQADRAVTILHTRASEHGMVIQPNADSGAGNAVLFLNAAAATIGSINTNASATFYNTSSDQRLKHSIAPLVGALDRVRALRPVSYRWNVDDSADEGFLAHQLMTVLPHAVTGQPDAVHDDGSIKPQQVDHSKMVPWLVASVQELAAQVQALTARIATLEAALGA
jgi:Concanavalin A-like lectin/glucanases superfamily/Chaperone of endosialidase